MGDFNVSVVSRVNLDHVQTITKVQPPCLIMYMNMALLLSVGKKGVLRTLLPFSVL